jgi:hypothetical protein
MTFTSEPVFSDSSAARKAGSELSDPSMATRILVGNMLIRSTLSFLLH